MSDRHLKARPWFLPNGVAANWLSTTPMSYQTGRPDDIYASERTAETPAPPPVFTIRGMMATREHVETWEEMEAALSRLSDEAWEGAHDELTMAALDDLAARLPDGYALDDDFFIVRL